jgi:hypothetical protein
MRRVFRRSSDARRASTISQKPSSGRRNSLPSLLGIPDEYSPRRRSSYTGSQQKPFRSKYSLRDRFIYYGEGINYPNVLRILLLMLVLFTITLAISLYRLFI